MVKQDDINKRVKFPGQDSDSIARLVGMTRDGWAIVREMRPDGWKRIDEWPAELVDVDSAA